MTAGDALFDLPDGTRRPRASVVLLVGPSGSGKTRLPRKLGIPSVALDEFYRDEDYPGMPRRHGMIDWDSPQCWDREAALSALLELSIHGQADIPIYDIPSSRRTGTRRLELAGSPIVIAEGIFAAELVDSCRAEGILADAICLVRPRATTFYFRLTRDFAEARKPPIQLLRRGLTHVREEPAKVRRWVAQGCRPLGLAEAEARITSLAARRP